MTDYTRKTAITDIGPGRIRVKGVDITEIMDKLSFAEAVFLLLKGKPPSQQEAEVLNAILVSGIDHGVSPPSVLSARTIMSGGNSLNAAIAGGVLAIGDSHGGAIEQAARIMQEWAVKDGEAESLADQLIDHLLANNLKMPGFGHYLHKADPRSGKLFEIAEKNGFCGRHVALCQAIESSLATKTGHQLPVNINGATAAVISDMGFDWRLGKGFFIISRVPGLLAHAFEEMTREHPMRKLGPMPHEYDGPEDIDL